MTKNIVLLVAGVSTLIQACIQLVLTAFALAQYFCLIDLLLELPLLLFIRVLYFQNPSCGTRVNIGQAIDGMADQASVLVSNQPLTTFRTFLINSILLGLSVVWILTSGILIHGGARNSRSGHIRWPWMTVMVVVFVVDLCATVTFITDTFNTRSLSELVDFVGGVLSGAGSLDVDTAMASWVMVMLYSRFVVTILFNIFLVVCVLVDCGNKGNYDEYYDDERAKDFDMSHSELDPTSKIPRVSILRRMPTWLSPQRASTKFHRRPSSPYPLNDSPERTPPAPVHYSDADRKNTVNFPDNLLSLPQRLENIISEQQRKLDSAVVDTSGRRSPPRGVSQHDDSVSANIHSRGRRGTAAELQGQLPWSYIPANAYRMRDQIPPDEELPPVPVPDYTIHPKYRKASVHRAGSNVSTSQLAPSREQSPSSPLPRSQQIMEADVLY